MTYLRFEGSQLPGHVGDDTASGTRQSNGQAGYLMYGPYFSAPAGRYSAGFYIKRVGLPVHLNFDLDLCAKGVDQLAQRSFCHADLFEDLATLVALDFDLSEPTHGIEMRVYVEAETNIEIESVVVFSRQARTWGAL